MLIETKNLIIRQYEMEDAAGILPILTDPTTMEFWPRPFTMQEVEDWAKMSIRSYSENGYGRYVLLLKEENVIIGDCGLIKATIAGENVVSANKSWVKFRCGSMDALKTLGAHHAPHPCIGL